MFVLCFEVWGVEGGVRKMLGAFWDVQTAWLFSLSVDESEADAEIIVASGLEYDVTTGTQSKRKDVK